MLKLLKKLFPKNKEKKKKNYFDIDKVKEIFIRFPNQNNYFEYCDDNILIKIESATKKKTEPKKKAEPKKKTSGTAPTNNTEEIKKDSAD